MGVATDEVDDLAQEVYVALYRKADAVPEGVELIRWLKGIARHVCLSHFRKEGRRARRQRVAIARILDQARDAFAEVEETVADESERALESCLKKLPSSKRRLVELRYERSLAMEEIAKDFDKSAGALRVQLHRIRTALKSCIVRTLAEAT
tara:strand:+ start:453 stop:905 length:453 start_codon:yes stop_codon:yes gene_type:complete